jgi:hypothetical protein
VCAVLVRALEPNAARGEYAARFVAGVLEEQSDDPVRRDVVRRKVAHGSTVVGVRPQIL